MVEENEDSQQVFLIEEKAYQYLLEDNYSETINLYEQLINLQPDHKSHYWYLVLLWLLAGKEVEAQRTWLFGITDGTPEQINLWNKELAGILAEEVERKTDQHQYNLAWLIRQYLRKIDTNDINNLLGLVELSIHQNTYQADQLSDLNLINLFKSGTIDNLDENILFRLLKLLLTKYYGDYSTRQFIASIIPYITDKLQLIDLLVSAIDMARLENDYDSAIGYAELGLKLEPKKPRLLSLISILYQTVGKYTLGIETAKLYFSEMDNIVDQVYANFLILRALIGAGGYWHEFCLVMERHNQLLQSLILENPTNIEYKPTLCLFCSTFFYPYFQDKPAENIKTRIQVAEIARLNVERLAKATIKLPSISFSPDQKATKKLKIGYVSSNFRNQSVGWLARWIFLHHNRQEFDIFAYSLTSEPQQGSLQEWYIKKVHNFHQLELNLAKMVERVCQDKIDILVDLDSTTFMNNCALMAVKPAPIQLTWLGWDTSGLSTIDYFIADPYVLPENAKKYYQENIWRLPQTYLAVDGFEVNVPTIRRSTINIPNDSIIYFSAQSGYKYNPYTTSLQMKILKAVPNSYFLIKSVSDTEAIKNFFFEIADAEGIDCDRIRFLSLVPSEDIHRANLSIADIMLDTYPYNGATTTMETLWMGIPMVTRVGQQFAARNSYTMMVNAGITEGIAWTDEEYVEWGIRLGRDENLRRDISWKLKKNRQTAPLWNGKKFTRDMENAYQQMWQKYLEKR